LVTCFLNYWPPLLRGAITFSILFRFWRFLMHQMWQFKFCLHAKNNGALPLDLTYFEHLNIIVATQFAINEQLKDLTHMLCLWIPCYQLYKEGLFFYILTLKYMCHFGMSLKKLNLKARHKIKNKISWLLFNELNLAFSYLLNYLGK
jgi:hypothetical protein